MFETKNTIAAASKGMQVAAAPSTIDTTEFFKLIWPQNGVYFIAVLDRENGTKDHYPCQTIEEAADRVARLENEGAHGIYHACAVFNNDSSRKGSNARALKSLFLDIDCGADKKEAGKGYETKQHALNALDLFLSNTGLPAPMVVDSGNGLHVYFLLADEIDADQWKLAADRLKAITCLPEYQLLADSSVTADKARILRPVGTYNRKAEPRLVHVIREGAITPFDAIDRCLVSLLPESKAPIFPAAANDNWKRPGETIDQQTFEAVGSALRAIDPEVGREVWWPIIAAIAQVFGEDGRTMADEWSRGDYHNKVAGNYDENVLHRQYDDALSRREENAPRCGLPTIFKAARAEGWVHPDDLAMGEVLKTLRDPGVTPNWTLKGDNRNSDFFARAHADRLRYVHELGQWIQWQGDIWGWCRHGEAMEAAKGAARLLLACGAKRDLESSVLSKLMNELAKVQDESKLKSMLGLSQSAPGISTALEDLDADPVLLGVRNGVLDLRTGKLTPNRPDLLITKRCNADYDPQAACPRWLEFLNEVFLGDSETIDAVQRLLGLSLTGDPSEEVIIFCVGGGANGKSVFGNVVSEIFGSYGQTSPNSILAARRADDHSARPDLAALKGARMVSINELPGGMQLDENITKQIAGRERISARHLYKEHFDFDPTFTPWVRTNHKPIIRGTDEGIWRRLIIVKFDRYFADHERDPGLETKLLAERDGILAWMARGAHDYLHASGPRILVSPAMEKQRARYRADSDVFGEFLEEATVAGSDKKVEQHELWWLWQGWCQDNGHSAGSKKSFTARLAERGFGKRKSGRARFYTGIDRAPRQ